MEVVSNSLESGWLPLSCRRAVIILLLKRRDLQEIKNWRTVSLLLIDCKILSRVLATRLPRGDGFCHPHWPDLLYSREALK